MNKMDSCTNKDFFVYGRNRSECEKAKKVGFLASILWVFLTIYIILALLKINMCLRHKEATYIMSFESWY